MYGFGSDSIVIFGLELSLPTALGVFVILLLGCITFVTAICFLLTLKAILSFGRAYRRCQSHMALDAFHPDASAGWMFVGDFTFRMSAVIMLSSLMTILLTVRDLIGPAGVRKYHFVAFGQLIVGIIFWITAVWTAHRAMVHNRKRWIKQLRDLARTEETKHTVTGFMSQSLRLRRLKKLGAEYPVWPVNLASIGVWIGSGALAAFSVLLPRLVALLVGGSLSME